MVALLSWSDTLGRVMIASVPVDRCFQAQRKGVCRTWWAAESFKR